MCKITKNHLQKKGHSTIFKGVMFAKENNLHKLDQF